MHVPCETKKRPGPRAVIQVAGGGPSAILFQTKKAEIFNSMETGWNFDKVRKPRQAKMSHVS